MTLHSLQPAYHTPADGPPLLSNFHWLVGSTSSGKDSQAMTEVLHRVTRGSTDLHSRVVMVHCDLDRVEWKGCRELAARHADHYGFRFEVVRKEVDLLEQVERRGKWPDAARRYCTSDQKRNQVFKLFTKLANETRVAHNLGRKGLVRILNVMGMRAEESCNRAKMVPFSRNKLASNSIVEVWDWLPLHHWKLSQVWDTIRQAGTTHHPAYDLGMPRLSCCFCIFAPRSALMLAGRHNPELLQEYVSLEERIGHTFKKGFRIGEIQEALAAGEEQEQVSDWAM